MAGDLGVVQGAAGVSAEALEPAGVQRAGQPARQALPVHGGEEGFQEAVSGEREADLQQGAAVPPGQLLRAHLLLHGQSEQALALRLPQLG